MDTEYRKHPGNIIPEEYQGWKFNWSEAEKNGDIIYELFVRDDYKVQGRISFKLEGGVADINIVETAPHNYGHGGQYQGVGGHLFAIACECSLEAGFDGVAAFTSKSNLVEYYKKELGAVEVLPRRLVIYEREAQALLERYMKKR